MLENVDLHSCRERERERDEVDMSQRGMPSLIEPIKFGRLERSDKIT